MAKRKTPATSKPTARKAAPTPAQGKPAKPYAGRKLSFKKIVTEIDKVLTKLETETTARGAVAQADPTLKRAELSLRAARNAINSACVPEFDIPF
jgi:hypothetical protein